MLRVSEISLFFRLFLDSSRKRLFIANLVEQSYITDHNSPGDVSSVYLFFYPSIVNEISMLPNIHWGGKSCVWIEIAISGDGKGQFDMLGWFLWNTMQQFAFNVACNVTMYVRDTRYNVPALCLLGNIWYLPKNHVKYERNCHSVLLNENLSMDNVLYMYTYTHQKFEFGNPLKAYFYASYATSTYTCTSSALCTQERDAWTLDTNTVETENTGRFFRSKKLSYVFFNRNNFIYKPDLDSSRSGLRDLSH